MQANQWELYAIAVLSIALLWLIVSTIRFYVRRKRYIAKLHRYAKDEDTKAQVELAEHYRKGDGVKKNCDTAYFWYKKAAYAGEEKALNSLKRFEAKKAKKAKVGANDV